MSAQHEALVKQLSSDLDAQAQLLGSVERSRNDLQAVVDTLKENVRAISILLLSAFC